MENSKIIFVLLVLLFSCDKREKEYLLIKSDLFKKSDTLFIKNTVPNMNNIRDSLTHFAFDGGFNGKVIFLKDFVDVKTFKKNNGYYSDKNYIYFYNQGPVYFPDLNIIPSQSKKLINYRGDYVSTDNKVFFQSKEIKNADYKTFKVSIEGYRGYYFANDKNNYYYKDSIISKK